MRQAVTPAMRIALTYAVAAAVWVLMSDSLLFALNLPAKTTEAIASSKGVGFVLLSSLLVFALAAAEERARRQRERDGSRQSALLKAIVDSTTDAMFVKDESGHYVLANQAARDFLGGDPVGRTDVELLGEAATAAVRAQDELVMTTLTPVNAEARLGERVFNTTTAPWRDPSGRVLGLVGVARDLSGQHRQEQEILELNATLEARVRALAALQDIGAAIATTLDTRGALRLVLENARRMLNVDAAFIALHPRGSTRLTVQDTDGFHSASLCGATLRLSDTLPGRAVLERRVIERQDLTSADLSPALADAIGRGEGFVSEVVAPLIARGRVKGVLALLQRSPLAINDDWRATLGTLVNQAAIAIDNSELFENLQHSNLELSAAYEATIEGWARALDLRDHETEGHSRRVTEETLRLAAALGFSEADLVHIRRGALLHDIGKVGIPDHILLKPGPLTLEEWGIMHQHPGFARDLLSPIAFLREALTIPYFHHERWNGSGYPQGLIAEATPLPARLFAVVDVWDALLSNRPYRPAWTVEHTLSYLRENAGRLFDPHIVEQFIRLQQETQTGRGREA